MALHCKWKLDKRSFTVVSMDNCGQMHELSGCSCVSDASKGELVVWCDRLNGRKIDTLEYRLVTDKNPMDNAVIVIFRCPT